MALTDQDVIGYMESLSNWGRWGKDDQRGALNYITPAKRVAAAGLIHAGEVVSTSLPLPTTPGPANPRPVLHFMLGTGENPESTGSTDFFGLAYHGRSISHIDALCHIFYKGRMFNGYPTNEVRPDGAHKNAIHGVREQVSGRGVFLDIAAAKGVDWLEPGTPINPEDLEAAERAQGVLVEEGDLLLVRTGRHHPNKTSDATDALAGLHASALPWLHERRVAVLGGDGVNDVSPSGFASIRLPIHTVAIVAMGIHLLDNQDLEPLGEACKRLGRYTFFYVVAPLYLERGTGSPATGLAMF